MRKLIFYGDSNTFGFDPRDFFGGCYPAERLWVSRVAQAFSGRLAVVNEGMNGRCLPVGAAGYRYPEYLLQDFADSDLFAVMLGTNDLLMQIRPDAQIPLDRMADFLAWLTERADPSRILVIAPPHVGSGKTKDPELQPYRTENVRMNEGFRLLAEQYHTGFADASAWGIDLAFDGIHFSEEGHRTFAEEMIAFLDEYLGNRIEGRK